MPEDFTPEGYCALMESFLQRGYQVRDFESAKPDLPHLIVRHDVDLDLAMAVEMAELEANMGVRSSYFVLLRGPFYNLFSPDSADQLNRIGQAGHNIGLHLDATLYQDGANDLDAGARRECDVLETLLDKPVRHISFHRPARRLLGRSEPVAERNHTYQPRFFSEIGYVADSGGAWRYGHPLQQDAVSGGRALQMLTHPIWWMGPVRTGQDRLVDFLRRRTQSLDKHLAANVSVHRAGSTARPKVVPK